MTMHDICLTTHRLYALSVASESLDPSKDDMMTIITAQLLWSA